MNNYKIKVNNEAESKEAQELFFELEYKFSLSDEDKLIRTSEVFNFPYFLGAIENGQMCFMVGKSDHQELTLPQLRDLAVLHRNDVKDRTHIYIASTGEELSSILIEDWWHIYTGGSWQKFTHNDSEKALLMDLIQKPTIEQGLISGADALRAFADGKEVEWKDENGIWWALGGAWTLNQIINSMGGIEALRLKPRTIKLEIEIPAPFEPKVGEEAWCLDGSALNGYRKVIFDDFDLGVGFWRTEEEIKQVVAALRGGVKG